MYLFIIVITALSIALYFSVIKPYRRIQRLKAQFEKQGYKVLVQKLQFFSNPILNLIDSYQQSHNDCYYRLKTQYVGYDIILWNVYSSITLIIASESLIKEFFQQVQNFGHIQLVKNNLSRLYGGGLIITQGKQWKVKRKLYSQIFNYKLLEQLHPVIQASIERKISAWSSKGQIDILQQLKDTFFNTFIMCYFGKQFTSYKYKDQKFSQSLVNVFQDLMQQTYSLRYNLFGTKFIQKGYLKQDKQAEERMKAFKFQTKQFVQERFREILEKKDKLLEQDQTNIISKLVFKEEILNLKGEDRDEMMEAITGDLMLFFFAGTDTTSALLTATLHMLNKYPHIREKLIEELKKNQFNFAPSTIKKWKYMDAVMNQTLRLYGPGNWLFSRRTLQKNTKIAGVNIQSDIFIFPQSVSIHCNPQLYAKPLQFVPQRWTQMKKQNPYGFISFGGGQRNCIGQYLARIEYKIALAKILQKYALNTTQELVMEAPFVYTSKNNKFSIQLLNK